MELRECVNWQVFLGELGAVRRVLQMRFDRGRLSDGSVEGWSLIGVLGEVNTPLYTQICVLEHYNVR